MLNRFAALLLSALLIATTANAASLGQFTNGGNLSAATDQLFAVRTATSSSSLTIGTGTQTLTTQAGLGFASGQPIRIPSTANGANYMSGTVTSYSGTTLVANITATNGSGTYAAWAILGDFQVMPSVSGTAGGDLSGSYPGPTVAKINGSTLATTTPSAGNLLIGSGTAWGTEALSGDASLTASGTLTVTKTNGVSFAPSATTDTTNAANIASGTLAAARLPAPSASTLGGVQSAAAVSHQFLTSITTLGVPTLAQPAFADLSGSLAASQLPALTGDVASTAGSAATTVGKINGVQLGTTTATAGNLLIGSGSAWGTQAISGDASLTASGTMTVTKTNGSSFAPSATTDTTNAGNINSGTLSAARLPNPSATTLGGVESATATAHQFLTAITTLGVPVQAQPAFTDISGVASVAQGGTGVTAAQGNGTKVQLSSGTTTTNDCVKFDANGNTSDAGAACGSGGGSQSVVSVTGTTKTFALSDNQTLQDANNAASQQLTIPLNASVPFPLNAIIYIQQSGAGAVSVIPTSGATLNGGTTAITLGGQFSTGYIQQRATDTWVFISSGTVAGTGTVLGSSLTVTSPSISGDTTTGLYTAGAGKLDVGISGVNVDEFSSTGEALAGKETVTSTSAASLAIGPNGGTNPVFAVDSSTASQATGIIVKGAATAGTTTITATDSGSNGSVTLAAKGAGNVALNTPGSGAVNLQWSSGTRFGLSTTGSINATPANQTGSVVDWQLTTNADSSLTASNEVPAVKFSFASNARTWATGNITTQRDFYITGNAHAFAGASTITDAATQGLTLPTAGSNATITNASGLLIKSASISNTGTTTNSFGINVEAATGATNNYAARLSGPVIMANLTGASATETDALCLDGSNNVIADTVSCVSSSARRKNILGSINGSLNEVMNLQPKAFKYKTEVLTDRQKADRNHAGEQIGFVAEDMAKVEPRLVIWDKDGVTPRSVRYDLVTSLLAGAVQDVQHEIYVLWAVIIGLLVEVLCLRRNQKKLLRKLNLE